MNIIGAWSRRADWACSMGRQAGAWLAIPAMLCAHSWRADSLPPPGPEREALRAHQLEEWQQQREGQREKEKQNTALVLAKPASLVMNATGVSALRLAMAASVSGEAAPAQAAAFQKFAKLQLRWDQDFLYVGSSGLPDHNMMVGITNWQRQVPMPQAYFGNNAWRVPLHPVVAKSPIPVRDHFLRGAIAVAVNGIPIFNPQNNRGEVSQEIGELDQWGGHCGRADDYHYHAAPLHLQDTVGKGMPVAYALDGYPIYGLNEPEGSAATNLDSCQGHETAALGYHYHASNQYPYVIGGFHGEVVERGGQVDPQPRAESVRPALTPLRGAKITGFTTQGDGKVRRVQYEVSGRTAEIQYATMEDGSWRFQFVSADGQKQEETYRPGAGGRGEGGNRGEGGRPPRGEVSRAEGGRREAPPETRPQGKQEAALSTAVDDWHKPSSTFVLSSPEVKDGGNLPVDYTGDGSGATLPLAWQGAPAGTKSYALVMHHLDPEGVTKWYWILYNIPAQTNGLPKNVKGVGSLGTGFRGQIGYEPPHSKGPGAKTYVLSLYALSAPPDVTVPPAQVNYETIMAAMKGKVLASSDLSVVYTRGGDSGGGGEDRRPMRAENGGERRPPPPQEGGGGSREPQQGGQRKPWMQMHGAEIDLNRDGVITWAEMQDDMNRAFAIYDRNKDGIITEEELQAAGDVRDGAAFAGLIYRHFRDLDTNGDGKVTREEMTTAVKFIFDTADQDRDGKVTQAEWQSSPNAPFPRRDGGAPPPNDGDRQPPQRPPGN